MDRGTPTVTLLMTTATSPIGDITIVAGDSGVRATVRADLEREWRRVGIDPEIVTPVGAGASPVLDEAARQLGEYLAGERTGFDLPLDPHGTDFQREVWSALARIPFGTTSTYAEQAAMIGRPTAVRAVAAANGRNPLSVIVPCHRVIGADGTLTGFAWGLDAKRWLLAHEGALGRPGAPSAQPAP
jgi:methylated-DNA-[protein]-cysteine S-methyltransferase